MNSFDCYELLKQIPKGKVSTYKIVANKLGSKAYRLTGQIIGKNPEIPVIPCHRVVNTNGKIGGYALGIDKKIDLLRKEGIEIADGRVKNFKKYLYKFTEL